MIMIIIIIIITNEGLPYTIGTIGLPRLARALLNLIGSCRIYYVFQLKASSFWKRYRSWNPFTKEIKSYYYQYSLKHRFKHASRIERYTSVDRR